MYELRLPQTDVLNHIRLNANKGHKKILISAPTGFGKTILSYSICKSAIDKGSRVLFTTHRIQLAEQTYTKFLSLNPSYLQGDSEGYDESKLLQIATLQTLSNRDIKTPDIVIIDEVHYGYSSDLIKGVIKKFPDAIFLGLSATPVDDDGYLLDGFDSVIDKYQTGDLIKMGWLVPFSMYSPITIDLSNVEISGNDYKEESLEQVVNVDNITNSIVENYKRYGNGKKFICFAINKEHASELNKAFNAAGIRTEMIVSGVSDADRSKIFHRYENGHTKGIINIEILTAGYDEPTIGCVILACPTKSWKKYIQCCGRGLRMIGQSMSESVYNGKSECIILDCAGLVQEHGLPDERKVFKFRKRISKVIDRELKIDVQDDDREEKIKVISVEKQIFLKRIGSLLDLYEGKVYAKEAELQEDVNKFLEKTGYFWYRQNSGKAFIKDRWVHFTSKSGLPDNTVFYKGSSFFFGLELKLLKGKLTTHQQETLPEMTINKVLFFMVENVYDVYLAIKHIEENSVVSEDGIFINNEMYNLSERQQLLRKRLNIPLYS
jgi:superfamily II DNA or RNA helicase